MLHIFDTRHVVGTEVTEERYYEMLEVLPPEEQAHNAFLVGEPYDHLPNGEARFQLFFARDDKFYDGGLATCREFKAFVLPPNTPVSLLDAIGANDHKRVGSIMRAAESGEVIRIM